jgi:HAD superfamily hydrolase (TIGR01509 family)
LASSIRALIFDWGDTLMRDLPQYKGAMAFWPEVEVLPGVVEALGALAGRFTCCVASNAGDSDVVLMSQALDRVGIGRYFHHLWTSRELGAAKPAREFFEAILLRLGLKPAECASIGNDYAKDIVPAKAMGIRTVWLGGTGWSRTVPEAIAPDADAAIGSMAELAAALGRLQPT